MGNVSKLKSICAKGGVEPTWLSLFLSYVSPKDDMGTSIFSTQRF